MIDSAVAQVAFGLVNHGPTPVLLLRVTGRIVFASRAAETLLASGRAFSPVNDHLTIRRQGDHAALLALLADAAGTASPVTIRLVNRQDDTNHLLTARSLPQTDLLALTIAELRGPLLLPAGWTGRVLDLTPSLAILAEALAAGRNLAEFAADAGLTAEGARSRLKKLLARTATRSQADLVSLVHRAAVAIQIDDQWTIKMAPPRTPPGRG